MRTISLASRVRRLEQAATRARLLTLVDMLRMAKARRAAGYPPCSPEEHEAACIASLTQPDRPKGCFSAVLQEAMRRKGRRLLAEMERKAAQ